MRPDRNTYIYDKEQENERGRMVVIISLSVRTIFLMGNEKKTNPTDCGIVKAKKKPNPPCAFLATRSRRSSTMILNKCDISPHNRKIFMMMTTGG